MAGREKRKDRYNEQEPHQDEDGRRNNVSGFINSYPDHMTHDQVQTRRNMINGSVHVLLDHQHSFSSLNLKPDEPGPFGLKLGKTTCLVKHVLKELSAQEKRRKQNKHEEGSSQKQLADEVKPSNFPAVFLNIGTWSWESKNEQDLVVKFYYKKRKLVWEFLYGSLKKKIEIQWAHLSAIKASVDEDQKGRLQIELQQAPKYYNETRFKAKRHTQWTPTHDFTGDQATICRRHTILFSPGVLDEHLKKLLKFDRLLHLSKKPFPFHDSPFFCNSILDVSNDTRAFGGPSIPISYHDHIGTVVPYVQNFVQPINSFLGHSGCNLPIMSGLMLPNSDDIATKVPDVEQRTKDKINEIEEFLLAPFTEEDDYNLAQVMEQKSFTVHSTFKPSMQNQHNNCNPSGNGKNDGSRHFSVDNIERSWSPSQIFNSCVEQSGNNQIKEILLPPTSDQEDYYLLESAFEVTMKQNCFKVDSTCKPSTQNQQKNSESSSNGTNNGKQILGDSLVNFNEENPWLPFQAGMGDSSSVGGVMNHVDDEYFSFNEHHFLNDGLASQEPSSWVHSQVNITHDFYNGGNNGLPLQGFENGGNGCGNGESRLQGLDNGGLPLQGFDNGGYGCGNGESRFQGLDNGGNGGLPLQGFDNVGNGGLPLQSFDNGGNGFDNGGNGEYRLEGLENGGNGFYYSGHGELPVPMQGFKNGGNGFDKGGNVFSSS